MITYLEQFQVHSKTEELQRFPIDSLLHRCKAFPLSAFSTSVGYLLLMLSINTIYDLTVVHCNFSRFIVSMTVHSWCCRLCVACYVLHVMCCMLYEFVQMCSDIFPLLYLHTEYFHWPKNSLCSSYSSLSPPSILATTDIFHYLHSFLESAYLEPFSTAVFSDWLLSLVICI